MFWSNLYFFNFINLLTLPFYWSLQSYVETSWKRFEAELVKLENDFLQLKILLKTLSNILMVIQKIPILLKSNKQHLNLLFGKFKNNSCVLIHDILKSPKDLLYPWVFKSSTSNLLHLHNFWFILSSRVGNVISELVELF